MHVVIGSGALGIATALALKDLGKNVRIVRRAGTQDLTPPSPEMEVVTADFYDSKSLATAFRGADVVYQAAQPPYTQWLKQFPSLQAAILDACAEVGASVVLGDNLYCYSPPTGMIREDSPQVPTSRKGKVRKEMSDAALEAHRLGRVQVALVRPSNFFGPHYQRSAQDVFIPAMRGKSMMFLGRTDQLRSFSYVPDAGRTMAAIGTSEKGWGEAWIAPVQPATTQQGFARQVWNAAGRSGEPKISRLSKTGASLLGIFSPLVRELPEMMYEFEKPFVVDSTKVEETFGVAPTDFTVAVNATLDAWRGQANAI